MTNDELLTKLDAIAREYYDYGLPLDDPLAEQLRETVRDFVSARDAEIARLRALVEAQSTEPSVTVAALRDAMARAENFETGDVNPVALFRALGLEY